MGVTHGASPSTVTYPIVLYGGGGCRMRSFWIKGCLPGVCVFNTLLSRCKAYLAGATTKRGLLLFLAHIVYIAKDSERHWPLPACVSQTFSDAALLPWDRNLSSMSRAGHCVPRAVVEQPTSSPAIG